jgi:hypothetical protein
MHTEKGVEHNDPDERVRNRQDRVFARRGF